MKKKTFLCIIVIVACITKHAKSQTGHFTLAGKIIGQKRGQITLSYLDRFGKQVKDTVVLQNGNFCFQGRIREPTIAYLRGSVKSIADDDPNSISFFLEPGKMTVIVEKDHFNGIKITGSKTQKEYEMLQKKYAAIDKTSDSVFEEFSKINYQFILTHPNLYISAFQLSLYETRWSLDSVRTLYDRLNPKIKESFYGKEIAETINSVDDNTVGKMAKSFNTIDINSDSINLLHFKGKYVLLDFWASWCVPCRQGNPHLLELFKKYHQKGLEIIGVSDDTKIENWKKAVEKDKVDVWYNILSEPKINDTTKINETESISKKFGIHVLPTKILIDKNGMIIGRYTGSEEDTMLDKKLSKILMDKKDYDLFAQKFPMNGELIKQGNKIEAMDAWCKKMDISFTPTIFINGYQLPSAYGIEDINYFLL